MQRPTQTVSKIPGGRMIGVALLLLMLGGCAGPSLEDYQSRQPSLVPSQFFDGNLTARGIVKNRSGKVIRTFDATIAGHWNADGTGTLDEHFLFNDGEEQTRTWTLTPKGNGYTANAGDVVEPGHMEWSGNAIHMNYVLAVPYNDGTLDVRMDDWMYLVTPGTVINQTRMSKWGVDVGELVLVIQKQTDQQKDE